MSKKCLKCYWFYKYDSRHCKQKDKITQVCDNYIEYCSNCECNIGEYKYNNKSYCMSCLLEEVGVDKIPTNTFMYEINGEFVGTSDDYSDEDVLRHMGIEYEEVD